MNTQALHELIQRYKDNFQRINRSELYKWKAVKHFQDNWNIDAFDFPGMLKVSLEGARNLMDSGKYYPRRMITQFADSEPETVRECFKHLFNENIDLGQRLREFNAVIRGVWQAHYSHLDNYYQDPRAMTVYLNFQYPDTYFFYKFGMFRRISALLEMPYQPTVSKIEDVFHYTALCNFFLHEIKKDNQLLTMHQERLTEDCYADTEFHLLTQDIIYAADKHLEYFVSTSERHFAFNRSNQGFKIGTQSVKLAGHFVDYATRQTEINRIGSKGELYVFEKECRLVNGYNIGKMPRHVSVEDGDGLGYDILSYDSKGNEKYIEVKTTTGRFETPFYITRNELIKSQEVASNYYLYRVFNFDEEYKAADIQEIPGELTPFCNVPSQYVVALIR